MKRIVILLRHGQSEWNLKNLFTGLKDPRLTAQGVCEAHQAATELKKLNLYPECVFTSTLARAIDTAKLVMQDLSIESYPIIHINALNERDYGALTGLNKDEAKKKWGEEQVHTWRRSYSVAPPGGESLRDTVARVVPYYLSDILPEVMGGKLSLVTAHGNSLRALTMAIEGLSPEEVVSVELKTGRPVVYHLNENTRVVSKFQH